MKTIFKYTSISVLLTVVFSGCAVTTEQFKKFKSKNDTQISSLETKLDSSISTNKDSIDKLSIKINELNSIVSKIETKIESSKKDEQELETIKASLLSLIDMLFNELTQREKKLLDIKTDLSK